MEAASEAGELRAGDQSQADGRDDDADRHVRRTAQRGRRRRRGTPHHGRRSVGFLLPRIRRQLAGELRSH